MNNKGCVLGALIMVVTGFAFWGTVIYIGGWLIAILIIVLILLGVILKS